MWIPEFRNNLLSVSSITEKGYNVTFYKNSALIKRKDGTIAMIAHKQNDLYVVKSMNEQQAMLSREEDDRLVRWHQRLGHLNFNDVRKLHTRNMVDGMKMNQQDKELNMPRCKVCDMSKMHQLPFHESNKVEKEMLGLIHTDICGPMSTPSLGGARYFATFIDDKTRYTEVAVLKEKSEILSAFKAFKTRAEKQTGKFIKKIRSDNAKEYLSRGFSEYLQQEGITRQLSTPYTPQQNGVAERANRTIVEMARSMLTQSKLPMSLWAEAVSTAVYIRNRCPTRKLNDITPYEGWTGEKPYVGFLRIFGSKVIALEKGARLNKFMPRGKEYILVGYSQESKAYRLWERGTRQIAVKRDVRFYEELNNNANTEDNTLTLSIQNKSETIQETERGVQECMKEEPIESNQEEVENAVGSEEEAETDESSEDATPQFKRARGRPKKVRSGNRGRPKKLFHYTANVSDIPYKEPRTIKEAMDSNEKLL
ncbi:Retrovirus-related Pol polyprotein from transposon TNT 1-94 [Anthophora plagiata]